MKKHICDICGFEFNKGIQMKEIRAGLIPKKKNIYICEKCSNVMKMVILSYRRMPEVK